MTVSECAKRDIASYWRISAFVCASCGSNSRSSGRSSRGASVRYGSSGAGGPERMTWIWRV